MAPVDSTRARRARRTHSHAPPVAAAGLRHEQPFVRVDADGVSALDAGEPGALDALARALPAALPTLVGVPEPNPSREGRPLFNSAVLMRGGSLEQRFRKTLLPTYDVFDEDRYFEPFHEPQTIEVDMGAE